MIGELMALGAAVSFAFNSVYIQRGLKEAQPEVGAVIGNVLGLLIFGLATLWLWVADDLPPLRWDGLAQFALAGFLTAGLGRLVEILSIQAIGAARTASIRMMDPLFAYALGILFLGDVLIWQAVAGIILVLIGLQFLSADSQPAATASPGKTGPVLSGPYVKGVLIAVFCSFLYAAGNIFRKAGMMLIPSATVGSLTAVLAGLVFSLITVARSAELRHALFHTGRRGLANFSLAAIGSSSGQYLMFGALGHISVAVTTTLRNLAPWFTMVLGVMLLGAQARITRRLALSTVLVMIGVALVLYR